MAHCTARQINRSKTKISMNSVLPGVLVKTMVDGTVKGSERLQMGRKQEWWNVNEHLWKLAWKWLVSGYSSPYLLPCLATWWAVKLCLQILLHLYKMLTLWKTPSRREKAMNLQWLNRDNLICQKVKNKVKVVFLNLFRVEIVLKLSKPFSVSFLFFRSL